MKPAASTGKVAILIATYNGERYLDEQLRSLQNQTWERMDLIFSDDGSQDGTLQKLESLGKGWTKGTTNVVRGPGKGFAENFRSLLMRDDVDGDYVAYCDQDDIWEADKLRNAVDWLDGQGPDVPALYCGRTRTFPSPRDDAMSPLFLRTPSFQNALVQSIAGANTMVMNRKAFEITRAAAARTPFVSHDWWTYLIVTGAGGVVRYNPEPDVLYRQHSANLVGANNTWSARFSRLAFAMSGRFRGWCDTNLAGLDACRDLLAPQAQTSLDEFRLARRGNMFARLYHLRKSRVYRQTGKGQAGLILACILGLM